MNLSLKIKITIIFGIILLLEGTVSMYRYSTAEFYDATILSVDNVREMSNRNQNPLYRDYYEEDVTVSYSNKTGTCTIKERFEHQLPQTGDEISILVEKDGTIIEKTSELIVKPCVAVLFGITVIISGLEKKQKEINANWNGKLD